MLYIPLVVGFSLVAFGYSQDLELQSTRRGREVQSDGASATATSSEYESSMQRALAWLITQRDAHYGWHNDTPKVLMALQLVQVEDAASILPTPLEMLLSTKQMEVETVIVLWRHREVPITPPQLALFALAFSALCVDPRQFHGHDLIGALQHHEVAHDLDFAYATLAACAARAHVRRKHVRRLLEIANAARSHNVDTVSVTLVALRCIVRDHRHRNLQHALRRPSASLGRQQLADGSFGNVYNTAVAMQALAGADADAEWNRTAAARFVESKQDPDGAFTDPGLTAEVLLAMSSKGGLGAIRTLDCGRMESDVDGGVDGSSGDGGDHINPAFDPDAAGGGGGGSGAIRTLETHAGSGFTFYNDSEPRNITVSYTLWLGTNVTENRTLLVTALRNASFYSVMQLAAEADARFAFEASEWPNGHYVHTLGGHKEEPMGYYYWLLYRLPEMPDPRAPPGNKLVAPVGVDDLLIEDGDHYLFWYKKL